MAVANDLVPIATACQLIGMEIPEIYGRSVKVRCPFGAVYHSDGGVDPAMRVYPDTNHAFCFAGCGAFSPVWLVRQAWGIDSQTAAAELLDRIGHKPVSLAQAWADVVSHEEPPDTVLLAEALKTYCARVVPDWGNVQYRAPAGPLLNRCLRLLDLVNTDAEARVWLERCKLAMRSLLP